MTPTATAGEIRIAYRALARRHHPDRAAAGSAPDAIGRAPAAAALGADDAMARLNEAYRVLCDPGRRAVYDRSLGSAVGEAPESGYDEPTFDRLDPDPPHTSRLSPDGPARVPWKPMLVAAAFGSLVVLVAAAFTESPAEEPPDGILRTGSCVEIEANGDAREIACTGEGDVVVELLIPTDARCPLGTMAHRDRLGLGTACIRA